MSGAIIILLLLLGLGAPLISFDPADTVNYEQQLLDPSLVHPFGTDGQGRDVLMRVIKGTEAFFLPGLMAVGIALLLGALMGAFSGYAEGWIRSGLLALLQLIDTLPRLVFIILVCTILNPSMYLIAFVVGILFVPAIAEVIRRKVEALASEDYILAHIAHGFRPSWILLYHILWLQCRPLLIRQGTYLFSYVLFVETALSYLGDYGVQEPRPSWGNMVAQTRTLAGQEPWPWLFPALAIILTISGLLAFGNLIARREESLR